MLIASALLAATLATSTPAPLETPAQHNARMHWWREARFGMFIHWGLYSVPAGKWGNETDHGEWIRDTAKIPVGTYEKFKDEFNPTKFDPDAWAKMAKDAGMKYVVITTKHHDGFNLFESRYSDWSVDSTPFKRDVMRELSTAVRKQGLTMGWYHSIMDWHHPDYVPRRGWEAADRPATGADFDRYNAYLNSEVTQLLTDYGNIGVLWFDGEWESTWTAQRGKELYDLCRKLQPSVIVNNRVSPGRASMEDASLQAGDYGTPEQYIPDTGLPGQDWETCMTMNDHWGYNAYDTHWKSSETLISNLVDIASKGGNYLLNVGPQADGTFPPEAVDRLRDIGNWMRVNGESIYGTEASVFEKLPWGRSTTKRRAKDTTIYLHVLTEPKDGKLIVPSIANVPTGAHLLGGGKVKVARSGGDWIVSLPAKSGTMPRVIAVDFKGVPIVYKAPKIDTPTNLVIDTQLVKITNQTAKSEVRYTVDGKLPTVKSPLYTGAIKVQGGQTLRAAMFMGGVQRSGVVSQTFVKAQPMEGQTLIDETSGLTRETFAGEWKSLPVFEDLETESFNEVADLSIPMDGKAPRENVGLRYRGYLKVPEAGIYQLELTSDDGSRLYLDEQLVIDADGLHAAAPFRTTVALGKGAHKLRIEWFNGTGGAELKLQWGKVGQPLRPVKPSDYAH